MHVRASAGLRIKPLDLHYPHLPVGDGWFDLQCPEQVPALAEFIFRDGIGFNHMIPGDDGIYFLLQFGTYCRGEIFQFEIDP